MKTRDINKDVVCENSFVPLLRTATVTGSAIDLAGFDKAMILIVAGANTDGTHTISVEESDASGSGFAAVAAAQLSGTPGAVAANTNQEIGYLGTKRYVRVVSTVTGSPSTGATYGAVVIKSGAKSRPQ